jgi:hypothetical protein
MRDWVVVVGIAALVGGAACGRAEDTVGGAASSPAAPSPGVVSPSAGAERYVMVGFWAEPTCGGEPVSVNRFPVHFGDTGCYTWPGRSGQNSASRFSCGQESFSYTQWNTLTCSGGQNPPGTRKTSTLTDCTQDVPPTLYSRVVDFSGCQGASP